MALGIWMLAGAVSYHARADSLERLSAGEGPLLLGHRTDAAPFAFVQDGRAAGFSVALCAMIAERAAAALESAVAPPEWVAVSVSDRFEALASGDIDLLCGATSVTEERQGQMAFTSTIYLTDAAILVDAAAFEADEWGARIGVLGQTTSSETIESLLGGSWAEFTELVEFGVRSEGAEALRTGAIDSLFGDRALLEAIAAEAPERYRFAGQSFGLERYALAVRLGDRALLALANEMLRAAFQSGEIDRLHAEWFDGRSMSAELRRAYAAAAEE